MRFVVNPKNVLVDDRIEFEYNGKVRTGTVERVGKTFMTVKHDNPSSFKNKTYSTYQFKRISSRIRQLD
jgi:hypothetical protein